MKDKRRGFTLVELMVVLSILLLASVLISGILIQGYKVYNRTENYSVGEDQFRKAVMSIENVVEDYNSKDVFIYTNKNKILLINDNYEIDNQESLMVVVPKGYAKKNIVYIKATNKNGDINLLQVSFSIDDKTRLLNDDKSDNISISVSNDDIVILINNLDISNNIEFSKNENLINMNIIGIKGNVDREYSSSFSTDINEKMDIELGINGEGSNNGNGNIGSVTTDKVSCNIFNHFISAKNIDINVKEFISQKLDVIRCEGIKFNKINGNEVEVEYGDVYPPSFTFLKKNSISINNIDSIDKTYITDEINEEDILNGVGYIEIDGYKVYLVNYYQ
ncbi:type II secretion system protein [Clostridium disporicum]|uniref:Prepilin-type N-terminal cleavage/methylation domain n=1 Tax=Clostridium disporicum TaxID=84024 RepID=A0A174AAR3_9CLOT|nr:type II secretion system protein [Clostridium disporicum]CUN85564.1 prepilin-type N-terminal cleavage/methylation domain [Clostridium disporicum]